MQLIYKEKNKLKKNLKLFSINIPNDIKQTGSYIDVHESSVK